MWLLQGKKRVRYAAAWTLGASRLTASGYAQSG